MIRFVFKKRVVSKFAVVIIKWYWNIRSNKKLLCSELGSATVCVYVKLK